MAEAALAPKVTPHVHVTIDVHHLRTHPKCFHLYYTHGGGPPDPARAHRVVWEAVGLNPGDRVDIELRRIPSLLRSPMHLAVLHSVFGEGFAPRRPRWGWSIPHGSGPVDSGEAHQPTLALGQIEIQYDVLYVPAHGRPRLLDPGIVLDPDPCP